MRIAILKLSSIGDVVHALPVAATLRRRLPGAHLTWIVERRESILLRGHPALDEILAVEIRGWSRGPARLAWLLREVPRLSRRLREARFDVVVDLQGLLKTGILARATGAPLRIGFATERCRERLNALFTNRRVAPPPAARHAVDQYLALLSPLDVREPALEFALPLSAEAESRAEAILAAAGLKPRHRLVVLDPGAGRPEKRWPLARFRELAGRLADEAAANVFVVWGPGEEADARAVANGEGRSAVVAPATDLDELVAILRRADVVVGGDTGPLHLAAALGTPCVGIYGPTSVERNGPYGAGHRAHRGTDGRPASVPVARVFASVSELLG